MEMLLKQLRALPERFGQLGGGMRTLLLGGLAIVVIAGAVFAAVAGKGEGYQYAFTNLTPEDSTEAIALLKANGIPHRSEANGAALSVPTAKVHDARLLLAAAGLPRGGGVGFELFDRGELGVSEFTQKVNFRRAVEGELARTIGRLSEVRSARVHLALPERALFQKDERRPSAAVVVSLQPGRVLGERELAGIRHLVSSAVSGLAVNDVTVVDGRGTVLTGGAEEQSSGFSRKLEADLESRIVGILEPVVGAGSVVARVTATVDQSEVRSDAEVYDPDMVALRSERRATQSQQQENGGPAGVAGAAANQPLQPVAALLGGASRNANNSNDETKNYEISRTTTTTVTRAPRLVRLSAAVIVDGVEGKVRTPEELARLGELARRAIGFDEMRGDLLEISSATFGRAIDAPVPADVQAPVPAWKQPWVLGAAAVGLLLLLALIAVLALRRKPAAKDEDLPQPQLSPGARVGDLVMDVKDVTGTPAAPGQTPPAMADGAPTGAAAALPDVTADLREKARTLVQSDPGRAALLLKAWLEADAMAASAAAAAAGGKAQGMLKEARNG